MTTQERAAKVLQEIDAALALAEKATKGPWEATSKDAFGRDYEQPIRVMNENTAIATHCGSSIFLRHQDAAFIALSRTGWPTALRCLKTAIEGMNVIQAGLEDGIARDLCVRSLTTLCNQWESK